MVSVGERDNVAHRRNDVDDHRRANLGQGQDDRSAAFRPGARRRSIRAAAHPASRSSRIGEDQEVQAGWKRHQRRLRLFGGRVERPRQRPSIQELPLKDASGDAPAQKYLVAVEEAGNSDCQDYVFVFSDVDLRPRDARSAVRSVRGPGGRRPWPAAAPPRLRAIIRTVAPAVVAWRAVPAARLEGALSGAAGGARRRTVSTGGATGGGARRWRGRQRWLDRRRSRRPRGGGGAGALGGAAGSTGGAAAREARRQEEWGVWNGRVGTGWRRWRGDRRLQAPRDGRISEGRPAVPERDLWRKQRLSRHGFSVDDGQRRLRSRLRLDRRGAHPSSCPETPTPKRFQVVMAVIAGANPGRCSKSRQMPPAERNGRKLAYAVDRLSGRDVPGLAR